MYTKKTKKAKLHFFTKKEFSTPVTKLLGVENPTQVITTEYRYKLDKIILRQYHIEMENALYFDQYDPIKKLIMYEGKLHLCTKIKYNVDNIYEYVIVERV